MNKIFVNLKSLIINRRILAFILLPFVIIGVFYFYQKNKASSVYATDPLVVTYNGKNPPSPMFNVVNLIPGDEVEKTFNVKNAGSHNEDLNMDGLKVIETKTFSNILRVQITDLGNSNIIFDGKLHDFFDLPPVSVGILSSGSNKNYKVKISFPISAGDQYQEAVVKFNIVWTVKNISSPTPTLKPTPTSKLSLTPTPKKDRDKKDH